MNLLLLEEYILSKESYFGFTKDQNKKIIDKNKKNIRVLSLLQVLFGMIFLVVMLISMKDASPFLILLATALAATGLMGKSRLNKYEKKLDASLDENYNSRMYSDNPFTVKFFDSYVTYKVGQQSGKLDYDNFAACYDGQTYFAIHFTSGDLIIFNKECEIKKIHDILVGYKASHGQIANEKNEDLNSST